MKTVDRINKVKRNLKNIKLLNLKLKGLRDDSIIFINPSLCPYYKQLAFNCRLLKRNKLILSVFTNDDGTIKVKLLNNSYLKITHVNDLVENFHGFNFSFKKFVSQDLLNDDD